MTIVSFGTDTFGIIFGVIVVVLFLVFYILIFKRKEKWFLGRGINLALFLVTLPQRVKKEGEREITLEEHLKTAEQFYSSLAGIKEPSIIKRWFLGKEYQ